MSSGPLERDILQSTTVPKVLVVEDEPVSAKLILRLFKEHGIACDHALDGRDAVALHRAHPYRLVVSDWMMPQMNGIELCQELRKIGGNYTYFILCSAKSERADRLVAYEAGVDDFLIKPLDRQDLLARLKVARRILASEDDLQNQKQELQRAQTTLQEMNNHLVMASRRFEELFNGLPVACFTFDEAGVVHEWNRAAEQMFGVPAFRAYQQPVGDILGMNGESVWNDEFVKQIVRTGGVAPFDWVYEAYAGSRRHFACSIFSLRDSAGRFVGSISANIDVTERKEAQDRIELQVRQINEFADRLEEQKHALEDVNELLALRADTDGLTGLLNHRRWQSDFENAFVSSSNSNNPLSVILLDVDHFKAYNDNFGHQAGDDVLKQFALILKNSCRDTEFVGRYGGEEFAVVLEGCRAKEAVKAAERFRKAIEAAEWPHRDVTASFGIATLNKAVLSSRDLLVLADTALYWSKEHGRNSSTHFDSLPPKTLLKYVKATEEAA